MVEFVGETRMLVSHPRGASQLLSRISRISLPLHKYRKRLSSGP